MAIRPPAQSGDRPLGSALRRQRRGADRLRGSHRRAQTYDDWCAAWSARAAHHEALGRDGAGARPQPHRRRSLAARRRLLSFRLLFVRARRAADEDRAHEGGGMPAGGAAVSAAARRARAHPLRRHHAGRHPAQAGRLRQAAGRGHGGRPRLRPRRKATPTRRRSWRAAWRRWSSKGRARARRNTISPSAATTRCRSKAVLDFVATRRDLDSSRIGMWGVSLGGYYAPRAAAFDERIKACIALGGPFNWGAAWDGLPELTREAFRVRSQCKTQERGEARTPQR